MWLIVWTLQCPDVINSRTCSLIWCHLNYLLISKLILIVRSLGQLTLKKTNTMKSMKFPFSFCIYDFHIPENEIQLDHIKIYAQE